MLSGSSSGTTSGISSFSFWSPADQPAINSSSQITMPSAGTPAPPSSLALESATTKTATGKASHLATLSALPTMLIFIIKTWLPDRQSLQLILTSRQLALDVQSLYKLRLRPGVAQHSASPIGSYQDMANRLPAFVPMDGHGEWMFQQCLALKTAGVSEDRYVGRVVELLKRCTAGATDLTKLVYLCTGACVALRGQLISAAHLKALVAGILRTCKTRMPEQMAAMILGVYIPLGDPDEITSFARHEQVLMHILASYQASTPDQLGAMIGSVCLYWIERQRPAMCIDSVVPNILTSHARSRPNCVREMIAGVAVGLGGRKMPPDTCAELMNKMFDLHKLNRHLPLTEITHGLFRGLGGYRMSPANLDMALERILERCGTWDERDMGGSIGSLCMELGDVNMAPGHRVTVVAAILASCKACTAKQVGGMMFSICYVLGGQLDGASTITRDNLDAILCQVLASHGTSPPKHLGSMFGYIFTTLGKNNIKPVHREILVRRIRESDHVQKIIAAIKLVPGGAWAVDFLQLETP